MNRRTFIETGVATGLGLALAGLSTPEIAKAAGLPFEQGKYQTFPRIKVGGVLATQDIDVGALGPDIDVLCGFDFSGDIPTSASVIHPAEGPVLETRVVFLKRVDLDYVQISDALSGDRFDMHKVSEFGIDNIALDNIARLHAKNTAHQHQKVVYIGDLGLFERQYGAQERPLLNRIIRAQRPAMPGIGIPASDFAYPRQ